ncbi:metalloregulator ArsR/SmtB family transcription factor [Glycomyces sp. NPDC021274]|uniref:ArsR/SmtB family transcription factor n=1 Tax=Glycomyces sp. NPDC021274 TaxID=3155120 RepID=UPI0033E6D1C3
MDYHDVDDRLFDIGRALGCRVRLALLRTLEEAEASVSELVERSGATQSNVSNHLAILRDAGLVVAERDGRVMRYRLASPQVGDLVNALSAAAESR